MNNYLLLLLLVKLFEKQMKFLMVTRYTDYPPVSYTCTSVFCAFKRRVISRQCDGFTPLC